MPPLERLSVADLANFAVEGTDTPMHQGALGVVDGAPVLDANCSVAIGRVRSHLQARPDRGSWPDLEVGLEGMRSSWRELYAARAMVPSREGLSALSA